MPIILGSFPSDLLYNPLKTQKTQRLKFFRVITSFMKLQILVMTTLLCFLNTVNGREGYFPFESSIRILEGKILENKKILEKEIKWDLFRKNKIREEYSTNVESKYLSMIDNLKRMSYFNNSILDLRTNNKLTSKLHQHYIEAFNLERAKFETNNLYLENYFRILGKKGSIKNRLLGHLFKHNINYLFTIKNTASQVLNNLKTKIPNFNPVSIDDCTENYDRFNNLQKLYNTRLIETA